MADFRRDRVRRSEFDIARIETRFVIGLVLRKHIFALSDEEVCERWVYDPYFQYSATGRSDALLFSGDPASWPIEYRCALASLRALAGD
jgi:hypothetical protein